MNIKRRIKLAVYTCAKWTGMFWLSRLLLRRKLMILAYHGFKYSDEASFRPILFMDADRFARRLDVLKRGKYPVLPLADAVQQCKEGSLPDNAVAITIDDGFFSVLDLAAPILHKHEFPSTLYVTSYYATKATPIFRLAIQYLFWKTTRAQFNPLDYPWSPSTAVDLQDPQAKEQAIWHIIDYGEANCEEDQRQDICTHVAQELGMDMEAIRKTRSLSLLTPDELPRLDEFGVDIQLHSHRHTFPSNDIENARKELSENRAVLEEAMGRRLEHFCYPSGEWAPNILPMLAEEGIVSATTCQVGFNDQTTDPLALYRFLDQDDLHDIEFEAELAGFSELLRVATLRRRKTDQVHRTHA